MLLSDNLPWINHAVLNVEFETSSKKEWKINNINIEKDFNNIVLDFLDLQFETLNKIMNREKLNNEEENMLELFAENGKMSKSEFAEYFGSLLSTQEKKEIIDIYKESKIDIISFFEC